MKTKLLKRLRKEAKNLIQVQYDKVYKSYLVDPYKSKHGESHPWGVSSNIKDAIKECNTRRRAYIQDYILSRRRYKRFKTIY